MATREPADPKQCQGERQVGIFQLGGRIGERTRCTNKPSVIATEAKPGKDGERGSMSLCDPCKAAMIKMLGAEYATFEPVVEVMQPCPWCGGTDIRFYKHGRIGAPADPPDCFGQCQECTACGPSANTEEEARLKWNNTTKENANEQAS